MGFNDDREHNTLPYHYQRLATEAAVIRNCQALGAVDLRPPQPHDPKLGRKPGFADEQRPGPGKLEPQ